MIRLPEALRTQLLANGRAPGDHIPVLKLFNPVGPATWLAAKMDRDGDTLFGLADLGFGCPEVGAFSLSELAAVRLPSSASIERDIYFEGRFPLSTYAEAARRQGSITEIDHMLRAAEVSLRGP
jgi:hypothetical protein